MGVPRKYTTMAWDMDDPTVLTLQPWLWGATVLTTTIAILLAILLRLQPRRKKRLAYVALRICKRRYAHKATQEVLDLKAYAYHLALCKTWMPTRFHGGAGGSRTTMRKRQQEQRNTNDIEDADTLAAALIALATAFQQRRLHQQPPHTRQTTSMQPDRQQPRPPRNNQKTTVAPKLDLYASIHRIFQDKTQDPLPALMTLLTQAQEIRQARHDKRSMKTTAEQPTTPATTTNDSTRSLPILKNQTSSPTTTGEQPPRLTFDTKHPSCQDNDSSNSLKTIPSSVMATQWSLPKNATLSNNGSKHKHTPTKTHPQSPKAL